MINFLVEDNANAIEDKIAEWTYIESDSDKEEDNKIKNEIEDPKFKHQIIEIPKVKNKPKKNLNINMVAKNMKKHLINSRDY